MVQMVFPFLEGADGVFVGSCLPGECHYESGNSQALGRVRLVQMILGRVGLDPRRLEMRMMSSAEGPKFVEYVSRFVEELKRLGPAGVAEGVPAEELRLKLEAGRRAVESEKVRWVAGKRFEFTQTGNLYSEKFTDHEIGRVFGEIVADECDLQEILLRTTRKAATARDLAAEMKSPPHVVVRRLADLLRMGRVEISDDGGSPLWRATE